MGRKKNWPPRVGVNKGRERVWWGGRWHDLGAAGSAEARARLAHLMGLWTLDPNATARRTDDYLIADLCRDYLASDAAPKEQRQRERATRAVKLLLQHHLATAVAEFGAADLEAWQGWLCRQTDDGGELKWNRTYIAHLVGVVRAIWKWGVRSKRTTVEQYTELTTVPGPKYGAVREPQPVPAADPKAVAAVVPLLRPPVRAMVELEALTGARPDELCRLTPADVLSRGTVDVPGVGLVDLTAEGVWVVVPKEHKKKHRRKPRWLVLGPKAQAVLAPFLERDPAAYCFSPRESLADLRREQVAERVARGGAGDRKPKAPAPARRPADHYTPRTYRQAVERACARAGVAHFSPYQLRHMAAAEIDFAFGLDDAQATLGHDDPNMTRRYAKRSFRAAARVARERG